MMVKCGIFPHAKIKLENNKLLKINRLLVIFADFLMFGDVQEKLVG